MRTLSELNEVAPPANQFFNAILQNIDIFIARLREAQYISALAAVNWQLMESVVCFFALVRKGNYRKAKDFAGKNIPRKFVLPPEFKDEFRDLADDVNSAFSVIDKCLDELPSTAKNVCQLEQCAVQMVAEKYARGMVSLLCSLACNSILRDFPEEDPVQVILDDFIRAVRLVEASEHPDAPESLDESIHQGTVEEQANRLVNSALQHGWHHCTFADFETEADFLALREQNSDASITEFRAVRQLASMKLREHDIACEIAVINTSDYLRWLGKTRKRNTEAHQSLFAFRTTSKQKRRANRRKGRSR